MVDPVGDWLLAQMNSQFFSALFGAGFGAFAGAWLSTRELRRNRLRDEILACNFVVGQCIAISNKFLSLKKACGATDRTAILRRKRARGASLRQRGTHRRLYLRVVCSHINRHLEHRDFPTHFFGRGALHSCGIAFASSPQSERCSEASRESDPRDQAGPPDELPLRYLGLPLPNHGIDRSFPDSIAALRTYTDDCIYFASLLADLAAQVAERLWTRLGDGTIRLNEAAFVAVDDLALMPNKNTYAQFESQYRRKNPIWLS